MGMMRFPGGWFVVVRLVAVGIMWGWVWGVVVGVGGVEWGEGLLCG